MEFDYDGGGLGKGGAIVEDTQAVLASRVIGSDF